MEYDAAIVQPGLVADLSSPSTPPQTPVASSSPPLPPPAAAPRAVRRLVIGDQPSAEIDAESSPPRSLERSPSPTTTQDWLPMDRHYPTPPPAPRKDQTPLSSIDFESDAESLQSNADSWCDGPRPPLKVFQNGRVYFHKSYKGPKPLGFVNTRLYEGGRRDFFVAYTEQELVWARRMDYVLRRHNL
jgi:hypothetical protein